MTHPMLGQVGKYSEIINNGLRKYILCVETFILCAEIFILCVETFSTPKNIFFSPQKKIKCPNIFSPLPRFTFGSQFFLSQPQKHFADPWKSFVFPRKIYTPQNFLSHAQFFFKKKYVQLGLSKKTTIFNKSRHEKKKLFQMTHINVTENMLRRLNSRFLFH